MKSIYIKTILAISIFSCFYSCTKEISVDVAHETQTVIFGELTNLDQQVNVTIQQTLPLNAAESFKPVNDAIISLYEKDTNGTTNLITSDFSVNQGAYSSIQEISGIIGNSYWIEVTLNDGTTFKSAEEKMNAVVPISSVELDQQFDDILNIKFSDPVDVTNFYKMTVKLFYQGQLVSLNTSQSNDVVFDGNSEASVSIDLFEIPDDEEQPLPNTDAGEVSLGNINLGSYQFLLNQSAQLNANEDTGDDGAGNPSQLFATPPVNLLGNITNTTTNRTALGNFTINSLSVVNQ